MPSKNKTLNDLLPDSSCYPGTTEEITISTEMYKKTNKKVEVLYKEHSGELLTFIMSKCNYNADNAHEIMQEVFIALARHINGGGHLEQARGLLYKISKTKIIDHYRKQSVRMQDSHDDITDHQPECDMPSQERIVLGEERLNRLKSIVLTLPPRCQKVFVLRVFEEMKYEEIAERCAISQSMVEKHISKAMVIIKQKMLEDMC